MKIEKHPGAGHRQRLRERFLAAGLDGFHDYEVVELLLTLATPRRDCKAAAKAAMARFKSLQGVMEAPAADLQEIPGIGPVNLFGVKFVKAVCERYRVRKLLRTRPLSNSRELYDYLDTAIRDRHRESFLAVYLDAKNRVIGVETLFEGTLTQSAVYPREVVLAALKHNAAAMIFAHNHPSGDPQPSAEDMAITRRLIWAAGLLGITVHEHIVIGAGRYCSLADNGTIARMRSELDRREAAGPSGRGFF